MKEYQIVQLIKEEVDKKLTPLVKKIEVLEERVEVLEKRMDRIERFFPVTTVTDTVEAITGESIDELYTEESIETRDKESTKYFDSVATIAKEEGFKIAASFNHEQSEFSWTVLGRKVVDTYRLVTGFEPRKINRCYHYEKRTDKLIARIVMAWCLCTLYEETYGTFEAWTNNLLESIV